MSTSRHAVITGATNGIGLAVTQRLAREGLAVTLVGRDEAKLAASAASVHGPDVRTARADFAVLDDVRALAAALDPADVVVSNAATIAPLDAVTADGHQRTLAVNHLAPYLLLRTLVEGEAPPARVVVVGADPRYLADSPVDLDHLDAAPPDAPVDIAPFGLYGRTKNMNAMTMLSLASRTERTTVVGAHPGIIGGTGLADESPGLDEAVHTRYGLDETAMPGVEVGADTPAWLATADDVVHGGFYVERELAELAGHVTDPARLDALWARSAELVGLDA